ncbi:DUF5794 domain-containing protein [Halocalculus aciditolerans]|uniref:Uncharacterized protein n=1 Tax=Halocalculus aciditolerans TaxID=1383812 RepID=A0A830F2W3_9EURY|nr:DUF5794 domain-containing protein [Halocalculus aciditolerans]GGL57427.1 hypothetical protein GCM10009039_14480 [Halocalculus aciditolerans]
MSSSRHPIALRLEQQVGGATRLLATVMLLPLVDGIFAALVLAGALDSPAGIIQTGLLVFGGSATVAVILAEMEPDTRTQLKAVALVGVPLVVIAALEAALAPTIESMLSLEVFERFAALVILAIAAKTASARIGEYLPSPAVIVGLGFVASATFGGVELAVQYDPMLMARAAAAALVGVGFAASVVVFQPYLYHLLDIDRFRFGSAVALGTLALSLFNVGVPEYVPLPVFLVASVLAIDPGAAEAELAAATEDDHTAADTATAATDGGADPDTDPESEPEPEPEPDADSGFDYPGIRDDDGREPWL